MTGRFPADLSVNSNWDTGPNGWGPNAAAGLPYQLDPKLPNVPHMLQANGYATAHFGKWHLGGLSPPNMSTPRPSDYGFDMTATYGSPIQANASLANAQNQPAGNFSDEWWDADVDGVSINNTLSFIRAAAAEKKPFYINLWLHMSHDTIDPRPEWFEQAYPFKQTCLFAAVHAGETICPGQVYWSAQTYTDMRLGQLFKTLADMGVRDNTIIVFRFLFLGAGGGGLKLGLTHSHSQIARTMAHRAAPGPRAMVG